MPPGVNKAPSIRTAPAANASVRCNTPDSARGRKSKRSMTCAVGSPATNRRVALRVNDAAGVRNVSVTGTANSSVSAEYGRPARQYMAVMVVPSTRSDSCVQFAGAAGTAVASASTIASITPALFGAANVAPAQDQPDAVRAGYSTCMYSIDLIALDLDGTLVDYDGNVSPVNQRAVRDAVNAGIRVALVTGRGADLPARLVRELRLNVPSICAHGALTKDFLSGRTIGHIPVPLQHAVTLLAYAERRGFDAAVYSEERFLRAHGAPLHMDDMRLPHWHAVTSLREAVSTPPTFLRFFGSEAVAEIRSTFAHLPLHFKHEVFGDLEECAVTSAEATKEIALARLCADLQIAPERVLAIGDSRNDVPMLRWAGIGVAMGNASPEIQREVGLVTGDCRDDGAAEAIRRYALRDVPDALSA